mmetsp:Transcript_5816/g.10161  ORF Transcript_5816/g.10161 Transcript_5816/m.10161 type:complete len:85 (-) Transcript_5816:401-655(-)
MCYFERDCYQNTSIKLWVITKATLGASCRDLNPIIINLLLYVGFLNSVSWSNVSKVSTNETIAEILADVVHRSHCDGNGDFSIT